MRADRDDQLYWSLPDNHCTLAGVVGSADLERVETSITYRYDPFSRLTTTEYSSGLEI